MKHVLIQADVAW